MNTVTIQGREFYVIEAAPGTLCKHDGCDAPAKPGFGEYCGATHWIARIKAIHAVIHDPETKKELGKAHRKNAHDAVTAIHRAQLDRLSADPDVTAFADVMEAFFQVQTNIGQYRAIDYAKGVFRTHASRSLKWVQVSDADFLADVVLAARRALSPRLFAFFDLVWIQGKYHILPGEVFKQLRRQLGRMFRHKGIWPIAQYRRGKFVGTHTNIFQN